MISFTIKAYIELDWRLEKPLNGLYLFYYKVRLPVSFWEDDGDYKPEISLRFEDLENFKVV